MIIQIRKYRQELLMLLSFPFAILFNGLYLNIINLIMGGRFVPMGWGRRCVPKFEDFSFPYTFMIWEVVIPLIFVYLVRKKLSPTFLISFFYIPELNYLVLKGLDFFTTTKIDIRYSHWLGYSFAQGTQEYPNYWLFLIHFILIYVAQYFIFKKYEQPNLVQNFALGVLSYFGFFFAYSIFYYILKSFS